MKKTFFWGVLVVKGLVGLHRTIQLQLFQHYWSGHNLDHCERFALETDRDHSVIFEIASKYFFNAMALIYCGRYVTHRKK